jgi:hypothetical protein
VFVAGDIAQIVLDWSIDGTGPDGEHAHLEGSASDVVRRGADGFCTGWLRVGPVRKGLVDVQAGWIRISQYDFDSSDFIAAGRHVPDFEPVRNARIERPVAGIVAAVAAAERPLLKAAIPRAWPTPPGTRLRREVAEPRQDLAHGHAAIRAVPSRSGLVRPSFMYRDATDNALGGEAAGRVGAIPSSRLVPHQAMFAL